MKPEAFLCSTFLLSFLALTVHKPLYRLAGMLRHVLKPNLHKI